MFDPLLSLIMCSLNMDECQSLILLKTHHWSRRSYLSHQHHSNLILPYSGVLQDNSYFTVVCDIKFDHKHKEAWHHEHRLDFLIYSSIGENNYGLHLELLDYRASDHVAISHIWKAGLKLRMGNSCHIRVSTFLHFHSLIQVWKAPKSQL